MTKRLVHFVLVGLALVVASTAALAVPAQAQVTATTSDGRAVLLNADGTWRYAPAAGAATAGSAAGVAAGTRPAAATMKFDMWRGKASVYYDPNKWHITKADEAGRTTLAHADGDGYAMVIAERIQVPLDTLKRVALSNAQAAAPDARIVSERRLQVNGVEVLELQIRGAVRGIDFTYLGYYYSNQAGSVQVLTYTGANLFDEYKADFQDFLNGFVVN